MFLRSKILIDDRLLHFREKIGKQVFCLFGRVSEANGQMKLSKIKSRPLLHRLILTALICCQFQGIS